jgi:hypothetical protein
MAVKTQPHAGKTATKRSRIDWDAIERDRRTGQFTLRELEAKYGVDNASIARRMKRDRAVDPTRWSEDLTDAVRQATNTRLMQELVSSEISKGQQNVSTAVRAAAELNTQVLLAHRTGLAKLAADADALQSHIIRATDTDDLNSLAKAASALDTLGRLRKTLIEKQRENLGISTSDGSTKPLREYSDEELATRLHQLINRVQTPVSQGRASS